MSPKSWRMSAYKWYPITSGLANIGVVGAALLLALDDDDAVGGGPPAAAILAALLITSFTRFRLIVDSTAFKSRICVRTIFLVSRLMV